MDTAASSHGGLREVAEELRARLSEAKDMLNAIRSGEVDTLIVSGPFGDRVFTLEGAEHLYRVMIEAMSEGAVILTNDGTISYANRSFAALLGARLEDVLGAQMRSFVMADHTATYDDLVGHVHPRGRAQEVSVAARDGSVVPVYMSVIPFESNSIRGLCAVLTDLTERKRNEELIAAEAVRLRIANVRESITDAFFTIDAQGRVTDLNQRAGAIFGLTRNQLIGQMSGDIFPGGRDSDIQALHRRAVARRVPIHVERCVVIAGKDTWLEMHVYPVAETVEVYVRDITHWKHVDLELRRSQAYMVEAQRLSRTGSWALEVATDNLFWSPEHFRICGVDPETFTLTREAAMALIHPEDRDTTKTAFESALRQGTDFDSELRILCPDGSIRWVHSFGRPVFDDSGNLTEYIGAIVDVTERKEAEQQRTELLRRLVAAQDDERRRISREMHDEFGQQLSALTLKLAALKEAHRSQHALRDQLEALEAMAKQLDADADSIVRRLRPIVLDEQGLADALASHVESWSNQFRVAADFHVNGVEPNRVTNEVEITLYRVAQEALNNVAKHARASRVAILLEGHHDHVSLIIEDDGIGFDAKWAFSSDRKGVGLIGMRERVVLLGGTLDIESDPRRGTTIVARIPIVTVPERRPRP